MHILNLINCLPSIHYHILPLYHIIISASACKHLSSTSAIYTHSTLCMLKLTFPQTKHRTHTHSVITHAHTLHCTRPYTTLHILTHYITHTHTVFSSHSQTTLYTNHTKTIYPSNTNSHNTPTIRTPPSHTHTPITHTHTHTHYTHRTHNPYSLTHTHTHILHSAHSHPVQPNTHTLHSPHSQPVQPNTHTYTHTTLSALTPRTA